jgi:DNA-binding Lrp family transcriptional regulator
MKEILDILRSNAKETPESIAKMLNLESQEVKKRISDYEVRGVIKGYLAVIDEEQAESESVTAVIEVKVTPQREDGFDNIAQRIAAFPEVQSVYLMSGAFDLLLFVTGPNLREVAAFVSERLAPLESVTSTYSHFLLKTYKQYGLIMHPREDYERLKISP